MYFGSVRFFKHLIYFIISLIFIIPLVLAIVFGTKYVNVNTKYVSVSADLEAEKNKQITEKDVLSYIENNDISPEDIIECLGEKGFNYSDAFFKKHFDVSSPETAYKDKYPNLYVEAPSEFTHQDNMVYLTFDDGPSEYTLDILDILDKYNIKATFFVTGNAGESGKEILKQIVQRGHTVGIHSYTHDLDNIYQNMDNFLDDFNNIFNYVYDATGVKPDIFRFAGGSINTYNAFIYRQICAEVMRRGFVYYDWNVSGEDACLNVSWTSIFNSVISGMENKNRAIILLHDGPGKYKTVLTVEDLIIYLKDKGYNFGKLDHNVKPIIFNYIE